MQQSNLGSGSTSLVDVILDSVADGVFTVDPDLRVTYWNRAAAKITGYSAKQAVGRFCHEVFRASRCLEQCPMRMAITSGKPAGPTNIAILTVEGAELHVSVSAAALKNADGTFLGGVESFRDMRTRAESTTSGEELEVAGLISRNKAMRQLLSVVPAVARSDAPVLICGQSGTGKDHLVRAIHQLSRRSTHPLTKLCGAAITDQLRDEELGGDSHKLPQWLESIEGGTLFLDEIADLSPAAQARLLYLLQQEAFQSGPKEGERSPHIRVLATSRRDVEKAVREGQFREDLYYRLGVVSLELPPLADHKEDIEMLVNHMLERLAKQSHGVQQEVTPEALRMLKAHDYPGNVRELENAVEHAFIVSRSPVLKLEDFPTYIRRRQTIPVEPSPASERERLLAVMGKHGGNKTLAANELGIHRSTLWRQLRKLGLA